MRYIALVLWLSSLSHYTIADSEYHVYIEIFQGTERIHSSYFPTIGAKGHYSTGITKGHLSLNCTKNEKTTKKTAKVNMLFDGFKFRHNIIENHLHLQVEEHSPQSKNSQVEKALKQEACTNIQPNKNISQTLVKHKLSVEQSDSIILNSGNRLFLKVIREEV